MQNPLTEEDLLLLAKTVQRRPDGHLWFPDDQYSDARGRILVSVYGLRVTLARWLWEATTGKSLDGMFLIKQCDKFGCQNPNHYKASPHPRDYVIPTRSEGPAKPTSQDRNRAKTHCPQGHEYTPDNTYTHKRRNGAVSRYCRICRRVRNAARRRKDQPNAG
jgi:hypothetical protein